MRVVIVDDDKIALISLKTIIASSGMEVVACGENGEEAIALYEQHQPDILLSDIRMEGMDGMEAAKIILEKHPEAKILFLTTFCDDEYVINALKYGAKGYILKQDYESIVPSLQAVGRGQSVFAGDIVEKLNKGAVKDTFEKFRDKGITEKEMDLITLVAEGLNNKEIAAKLCLSEGTVRNYLSSVLDKLRLRDRTQLVVFYYR
ncbi:MAG: response regulator transcription factor [Lachnospiraceae bacterium]|nr:response regulator transcription factor [Lachnospiraceae bacterium]